MVRFIVTQLETLMVRSRKFALELIMALVELFLTSLDRVRCQIYRRSKARRCYLVDRDAIIVRENVLLVVSALQIVVLVHWKNWLRVFHVQITVLRPSIDKWLSLVLLLPII